MVTLWLSYIFSIVKPIVQINAYTKFIKVNQTKIWYSRMMFYLVHGSLHSVADTQFKIMWLAFGVKIQLQRQ